MVKILRYLGIGKETTYGVQVPADFHVDIASSSLDTPGDTQIEVVAGMGRGANKSKAGFYSPEGDFAYLFDLESIKRVLPYVLGGGVESDRMVPSNNLLLPSFTARLGKDTFEHVFSGCVANSLNIEVSNELAQATVSINAQKDGKGTLLNEGALLLNENYPIAFHEVTSSISFDNGATFTDNSADVQSVTINIENNVDVESGRGLGSRFPYKMVAKERNVTFSYDKQFNGTSELENFWGGAEGPTKEGSKRFAQKFIFTSKDIDTGVVTEMEILFPSVEFTSVSTQPSGKDVLVQSLEAKAYEALSGSDRAEVIVSFRTVTA